MGWGRREDTTYPKTHCWAWKEDLSSPVLSFITPKEGESKRQRETIKPQ